jgi:tRNA pseudouridine32 synthase / 23S rRNA pseudouridine746 synthase
MKSKVHLPPGPHLTVLDALCARFAAIPRETWLGRMQRGLVLDARDQPLAPDAPYAPGLCVQYFREVAHELPIPFREQVLHVDADLIVVDKPHFLPVMPTGGYVRETLLSRLIERFDRPDLVPLHRIDRVTAGLLLVSCNAATRARYQELFRTRQIVKRYEALAPPLSAASFPILRRTRLAKAAEFFRMRELDGAPNTETRIDVIERGRACWRYALTPRTGKKHQLRVHMAALGAPILGDRLYPSLQPEAADDYAQPLQLLARALELEDPFTGQLRRFESQLTLRS